ncbi:MAG: tRNA (guanine-N1)-methyltransferase, partial [Flavobacteriaceae bacterium]|nr:tRNA (guanine-N1)-methyltransferase [Flavobacteriaceae bacterium]
MKIKIVTLLFLHCCILSLSAQEEQTGTVQVFTNTIEDQFNEVVDESNDYQDYKVIKKNKINKLRQN